MNKIENKEFRKNACYIQAVILVDKPRIRDGNFRAYLYRVARNKANRLWKKWLKRNEFSLDETLVIADTSQDSAPEDVVLARERNASLQRCLNRISPQYREALWLIYDRIVDSFTA